MSWTSEKTIMRIVKDFETYKEEKEKGAYKNILIAPDEQNLLIWYFLFYQLEDSFSKGHYIGQLEFPKDYPIRAPTIKILTPNGRFEPNKNLCVGGLTHFHNEDWSPCYRTVDILYSLLSFMYDDKIDQQKFIGQVISTPEEKKKLAQESIDFNQNNFKSIWKLFENILK